MRTLVFLLILANLLFFAWTQGYFGTPSNPDTLRVSQQLLADRVRIAARSEAEADVFKPVKPVKPVTMSEKKAPDVCLLLAELSIADSERVEGRLAEALPAFRAQRMVVEGRSTYWVFIPPLSNKQDADNKVAELKRLGFSDTFVVHESGPNNRAISLGLFSSAETATAQLTALRGKGVKVARIAERTSKGTSVSLELTGPDTQVDALRQVITEVLPSGKPVTCKPPLPAT